MYWFAVNVCKVAYKTYIMHELQGPGGIWCDVDVVEFHYYGTPAFTPKEHVYTELAEGLRGNDPYIGPGSQV